MRREQRREPTHVEDLLERWRAAGDPRYAAHRRGEAVLLSVLEAPGWPHEPDVCQGFPDDLELGRDGVLRSSTAYFARRLLTPLPYTGTPR